MAYIYKKLDNNLFLWERYKIVNDGYRLIGSGEFSDLHLADNDLDKIREIQDGLREKIKLILYTDKGPIGIKYSIKYGLEYVGNENINNFLYFFYKLLLNESFISDNVTYEAFQKDINNNINCFMKTKNNNGVELNKYYYIKEGIEFINFDNGLKPKKDYTGLYIHGFKSSGNSNKSLILAKDFLSKGKNFLSFSFRGNGASISSKFQFEDMNIDTQLDDLKFVFDSIIEKNTKIIPIASSLGAYILGLLLRKYPEYGKSIEKIFLLAPSLNFGKNRERQMSEQELNEWKNKGYIVQSNYSSKTQVKVNYELYLQSKKYGDVTDDFGHSNIDIFIVHSKDDNIVLYKDLENLFKYKNIQLISGNGGHRLLEGFDIISKIISN